jgi:hypothetical protein
VSPEGDEPLHETGEAISTMFRSGVAALMVGMQHSAQVRALSDRQGQHDANQAALDATERLKAERDVAAELHRRVASPGWWQGATATDVAQAVAVASAWEGSSPDAARALDKLLAGIDERPELKASLLAQHPQMGAVIGEAVPGPTGATTAAGTVLAVAAEAPDPPTSPAVTAGAGSTPERIVQDSDAPGQTTPPAPGGSALPALSLPDDSVAAQLVARVSQSYPAGMASPLARMSRAAAGPGAGRMPGQWLEPGPTWGIHPTAYPPQLPVPEPEGTVAEL